MNRARLRDSASKFGSGAGAGVWSVAALGGGGAAGLAAPGCGAFFTASADGGRGADKTASAWRAKSAGAPLLLALARRFFARGAGLAGSALAESRPAGAFRAGRRSTGSVDITRLDLSDLGRIWRGSRFGHNRTITAKRVSKGDRRRMRVLQRVYAIFARRRRDRRAAGLALALAAALAFAAPARAGEGAPASAAPQAQSDDGFFKSVLKDAHMTTDDLGHPQDFVVKSRPKAPADY